MSDKNKLRDEIDQIFSRSVDKAISILDSENIKITGVMTLRKKINNEHTIGARAVVANGKPASEFDKVLQRIIVDAVEVISEDDKDDDNTEDVLKAISIAMLNNPLMYAVMQETMGQLKKDNPELVKQAAKIRGIINGLSDLMKEIKGSNEEEERSTSAVH